MAEHDPLTRLLTEAADGQHGSLEAVFPIVYDELRRIGHAKRRGMGTGDTLRTTALVNEAYLRLVGKDDLAFEGRIHFFRTAARAMRDLLVEEARRKASSKRGGDRHRVELDELGQSLDSSPEEVLALDEALAKLKQEDERDFDVVMLRYFAGLTIQETAKALGVTTRTVDRRWRFCRSWLARELAGGEPAAQDDDER